MQTLPRGGRRKSPPVRQTPPQGGKKQHLSMRQPHPLDERKSIEEHGPYTGRIRAQRGALDRRSLTGQRGLDGTLYCERGKSPEW